jgi:hypothetical protein
VVASVNRWIGTRPPTWVGLVVTWLPAVDARSAPSTTDTRIGDQTGDRVFLFLFTDDLPRDYQRLRAAGVRFTEQPRQDVYGDVVVFEDLYGNRWDLIQPAAGGKHGVYSAPGAI